MMKSITSLFSAILLYFATACGAISHAEENPPTVSALLESSYSEMVKGDLHRDAGNIEEAIKAYNAALSGFINVAQKNPELDTEVVRFRIAYCDNQMESLMTESRSDAAKNINTTSTRPLRAPQPVQSPSDAAQGSAIKLKEIKEQIIRRQLTEARDGLIAMMKKNPDDPEIRILMGIVQCMLGRFDDADNLMTTLIEEQPGIAHAYVILSTAKIGLGDAEAARGALEKAIDLKTHIPEAYYNMTRIILSTKPVNTNSATALYRKSIELGGHKDSELEYLLK